MTDLRPYFLRKRSEDRSRAGFTLLEMLIAVTLLALMAAVLTGALHFGTRVWQTSERVDREARIAAVQRLLFQWLQETEQMAVTADDGSQVQAVFGGDAHSLRFLAAHGETGMPGGYYLSDLYTDKKEDGATVLVLARRLVRPDLRGLDPSAIDAAEPVERELIEGIAGIEIAYFGREAPDATPSWLDEWNGRFDLPALVRIRLAFAPGDRRDWPEIVIPLTFSTESGNRTN